MRERERHSNKNFMPSRKVTLIVVIPIGPNCVPEHIIDTIESVHHYTTNDRRIILLDDSRKNVGQEIATRFDDIDVVSTKQNLGLGGGLYVSLSKAYTYALENYHFDALLRLDTDALVTGPNPEDAAIAFFRENPRIAVGGLLIYDNDWLRVRLIEQTQTSTLARRVSALLRRPYSLYRMQLIVTFLTLRKLHANALKQGYSRWEYVFGGAYFMNESFLRQLKRKGWLPNHNLRLLEIQEDQIFGMLAKMFDRELADMHSGALPFACNWNDMPAAPQEIAEQGKTIIHSTRRWQEMKEDEIRAFFRARRRQDNHTREEASI